MAGRREANKAATRRALEQAADRLFEEKGFAETTTREIAAAAGVTERTLFRYVGSKEELRARRSAPLLDSLAEAIRARPGTERPLVSAATAAVVVGEATTPAQREALLEVYGTGPLVDRMSPRRSVSALIRAETVLLDALTARVGTPDDALFSCEVAARTTVAVLRSVMLHRAARPAAATDLSDALREAFAEVGCRPRPTSEILPRH